MVEMEYDGTRKRTGGEVKGKKANGGGSQQSCTVSDTVYWTDTPADINGLVRFAGKPNLVPARVPSHSVSALLSADSVVMCFVFIVEQSASFDVYNINWSVFITENTYVVTYLLHGSESLRS